MPVSFSFFFFFLKKSLPSFHFAHEVLMKNHEKGIKWRSMLLRQQNQQTMKAIPKVVKRNRTCLSSLPCMLYHRIISITHCFLHSMPHTSSFTAALTFPLIPVISSSISRNYRFASYQLCSNHVVSTHYLL